MSTIEALPGLQAQLARRYRGIRVQAHVGDFGTPIRRQQRIMFFAHTVAELGEAGLLDDLDLATGILRTPTGGVRHLRIEAESVRLVCFEPVEDDREPTAKAERAAGAVLRRLVKAVSPAAWRWRAPARRVGPRPRGGGAAGTAPP